MDCNGQSAIVTGAASGLGAATARRLAGAGARVAILDSNIELARRTAAEIGATAIACDVAGGESVDSALAEVRETQGPARIVVHCAGVGGARRIVGREGAMPLADFERIVRINLVGTFNVMRLAAAGMSKLEPLADGERGVFIATASIAAYEGQVGQAAYAASKGGIVALTLPAARELAQFGIRVVTIAPGLFLTPLVEELPLDAQQRLAASIPFPKRLGDPDEFARLALAMIDNRTLNGEVVRLDGALRMGVR